MNTNIDTIVPRHLRSGENLVNRSLDGRGRVTCLFKRWRARGGVVRRARWYPGPRDDRKPGYSYGISYVIAGRANLTDANGIVHGLGPGTAFQFSGVRYRRIRLLLKPAEGFFECSLNLDGPTGDRLAEMGIWDPSFAFGREEPHAGIVAGYLDMYNTIADHTVSSGTVLRRAIVFLERLYGHFAAGSRRDGFTARACRLLENNPQPGFTMRMAARRLGLPYDAFRRTFRGRMGLPPGEYQLIERMNQARNLLVDHSVKEAATALGYTDQFVFSRQFKQVTGLSPRHFKG